MLSISTELCVFFVFICPFGVLVAQEHINIPVKDACHRATTEADAVPSLGTVFGISGVPPERYVAE